MLFLKELLDAHQADWQPIIHTIFGPNALLQVELDATAPRLETPVHKEVAHPTQQKASDVRRSGSAPQEKQVTVAPGTVSKQAELLLSAMPGTLIEITSSEGNNV